MARARELRWKRDNGSWIFGGVPEGCTGKETGILLRLKLIKHLKLEKMVLDVGCPVGASLQPLKKHGFEPFVIDYMMPPLDKIQQTPLTIAVRKIFLSLSKVPIIKKFGVSVMIVSQRARSSC